MIAERMILEAQAREDAIKEEQMRHALAKYGTGQSSTQQFYY